MVSVVRLGEYSDKMTVNKQKTESDISRPDPRPLLKKMRTTFSFLISVILIICSCSPFSKEVMQQVDEIRPFREIQKSPETYVKKTVLWGGVIIETTNKQSETLIKVLQTELDVEKRPENLDVSGGRFLVHYPGFLDPNIYEKGREITVIGEIVGKEVFNVGEIQYIYPVVLSKDIHLWERRSEYMYGYPSYWDYYPYWWRRNPYWRYPYPGR